MSSSGYYYSTLFDHTYLKTVMRPDERLLILTNAILFVALIAFYLPGRNSCYLIHIEFLGASASLSHRVESC